MALDALPDRAALNAAEAGAVGDAAQQNAVLDVFIVDGDVVGEAPSGDVADVDDAVAQIDLEIGVLLLDERRCGDACADHGINDRVRAARGFLHQNGRPGGQSAEHEAAASGRDFGIFNGRLAGVFDQQSGDLLDRLVAAVLKIAAAVAAGGEDRQTLSGDGLPVCLRLKARTGGTRDDLRGIQGAD